MTRGSIGGPGSFSGGGSFSGLGILSGAGKSDAEMRPLPLSAMGRGIGLDVMQTRVAVSQRR